MNCQSTDLAAHRFQALSTRATRATDAAFLAPNQLYLGGCQSFEGRQKFVEIG